MKKLSIVTCAILSLLADVACSHSPKSYVDKGARFAAEGKLDEAVLNFRKAIQKNAAYGEAYLELGKAQLKMHDVSEAYWSFVSANQLSPQNDDAKIQLGDVAVSLLIQDERHPRFLYEQVSQLRDKFLAKDANSFDGLRWKGYLAIVDRKPEEAIECFSRALKAKPGDTKVAAALVDALIRGGHSADAERVGLERIDKDQAGDELYDILFWHYRSNKQFASAESVLKKKISHFPANSGNIFELAAHYYEVQEVPEMNRLLAEFIQKKTQFAEAPLQVGDFYMKVGMPAEAIRIYEENAKGDAKNARTYRKRLAAAYIQTDRTKEAKALVEQLYKESPGDSDTRLIRASLLSFSTDSSDVDRAIVEFQSLRKDLPKNASLCFGLGQALARKGQIDEARKEYQAATAIDPRFIAPRYALAEIAITQNKSAELLRQGEELLRLQPFDARASRFYAMGLAGTGATDQARIAFQRLLRQNPADKESRLQLVLLEIESKRYKEAEAILKTPGLGPHETSDPRFLQAWAQLQISENQPKQAVALLDEVVSKQPNNRAARLLLARLASGVGQLDVAIEQYKRLIERAKSAELYYNLGLVQEAKGDYPGALETFQAMKRLAPDDFRSEFAMGHVSEADGRMTDAIEHYNNALKLNTDNPVLLNNLAFLLADSGADTDRALDLARIAQAKLPSAPSFADTVGYTYLKKNMTDSAIQVFSGLVQRYPNRSTYRYHLALALLKKGDKDRALQELKACLKEPQPQKQAQKVNALLTSLH